MQGVRGALFGVVAAVLVVSVGCGDGGDRPDRVTRRDGHYRAACALLDPWTPARNERARRAFARTDRPRPWRRGVDVQLASIARIADPTARARAVYEFRFSYCTPENTEAGGAP